MHNATVFGKFPSSSKRPSLSKGPKMRLFIKYVIMSEVNYVYGSSCTTSKVNSSVIKIAGIRYALK